MIVSKGSPATAAADDAPAAPAAPAAAVVCRALSLPGVAGMSSANRTVTRIDSFQTSVPSEGR